MRWVIRPGTANWPFPRHRMAEVDSRRIMDMRPVGDNASCREFPSAIALFVFVEIASAHHDLGFATLSGERVRRNAVNLAFGDVAADREVRCGDVVLHRPDIGPRLGKRPHKSIDGARREGSVAVFGVWVIKTAHAVQIAPVYRTAVTVHELSQRIFIEHLLYVGRGDGHRPTLAAGLSRQAQIGLRTQMASGSSAKASAVRRARPIAARAHSGVAAANPHAGVTPMRSRRAERPKPSRSMMATTLAATSSTAGGRGGGLDDTTPSMTTRPDSTNSAMASKSPASSAPVSTDTALI